MHASNSGTGHGSSSSSQKAAEDAAKVAGGMDESDLEEGGSVDGSSDGESHVGDAESLRAQVEWCDGLLKLVLEREHAYHVSHAVGCNLNSVPLRKDRVRNLPWAVDSSSLIESLSTLIPPAGTEFDWEYKASASAVSGGSHVSEEEIKHLASALSSRAMHSKKLAPVIPLQDCLRHPLVRCLDSGFTGYALVDAAARLLRISGSVPARLLDILIAHSCKYFGLPWQITLGWLAGRCIELPVP